MPGKHAILSPSASERWLACPPSARLCDSFEDTGSSYAEAGTQAHALCEFKLKQALGKPADNPMHTLTLYDAEMEDAAAGYTAYVMELVESAKCSGCNPIVLIEQKLAFTEWVQDGYGRADCIIVAGNTLHVVDFKFGVLEVLAPGNSQLQMYGLGSLQIFDGIFDIEEVQMHIYQPRKSNISVATMTKDALLEWANTVLKPTAQLAYEGKGEFSCGSWCRFCKAKAACRTRADANLVLARYDFQIPALLDDAEIAEVLGKVDALTAWANDIKEYALQQAVSGKRWPGWKLVEGRSNRKYTDDALVAAAVEGIGLDPYEKKVLGVTAMQKMLGKARFEELLSPYIHKPAGRPTLVLESDKRPAMNTAKHDFMEEF